MLGGMHVGEHVWQGNMYGRGVHGRGHAWQEVTCMAGSVRGRGACVAHMPPSLVDRILDTRL